MSRMELNLFCIYCFLSSDIGLPSKVYCRCCYQMVVVVVVMLLLLVIEISGEKEQCNIIISDIFPFQCASVISHSSK